MGSPLFTVINALPQLVKVSIGNYVQTLNHGLGLENITCLDSLNACLTHRKTIGADDFDGDPVQEVKEIVSKNSKLKSLHIALQGYFDLHRHDSYEDAKLYALGAIGPVLSQLESLTLEGDLCFSDQSWPYWIRIFQRLKSLSLIGLSLINSVASHDNVSFPHLKTLSLDATHNYRPSDQFLTADLDSIHTFLSRLKLTRLCIFNLDRGALLQMGSSARISITSLSLHVRGDTQAPIDRYSVGWPPDAEPLNECLVMTNADLKSIESHWLKLQYLSIEILECCDPLPNKLRYNSATSQTPSEQLTSSPPGPSLAGFTPPIDFSTLDILARMQSLRQLTLFFKFKSDTSSWLTATMERKISGSFVTSKIFAVYLYLCRNKRGNRLEKFVLHFDRRPAQWWEIQEQGPKHAVIRLTEPHAGGYFEEVWNMTTGKREEEGESLRESRLAVGGKTVWLQDTEISQ